MSQTVYPIASKGCAYQELDLSQAREFVQALINYLSIIDYDSARRRSNTYDLNLTSARARGRVNGLALQQAIKEAPRKNTAIGDQNVLALDRAAMEPSRKLAEDVFVELLGQHPSSRVSSSGAYWYPSNGYMGWHTNNAARGCRLYCTYTSESTSLFSGFAIQCREALLLRWTRLVGTSGCLKLDRCLSGLRCIHSRIG